VKVSCLTVRPAPGTAVVTDKGLSGEETEAFFASDEARYCNGAAIPIDGGYLAI
jgi:hypothetical protein